MTDTSILTVLLPHTVSITNSEVLESLITGWGRTPEVVGKWNTDRFSQKCKFKNLGFDYSK